MGPARHLLLCAIACSLVTLVQDARAVPTPAAVKCSVEMAIQETNLCSNVFRKHITDKPLNASDPKDLKEACCTVDRLERCLQAAASNAGCKEEVSVLVSSFIRMAKNLVSDVYKTRCRFKCNSSWATSAPGLQPLLLLVAVVTLGGRL